MIVGREAAERRENRERERGEEDRMDLFCFSLFAWGCCSPVFFLLFNVFSNRKTQKEERRRENQK